MLTLQAAAVRGQLRKFMEHEARAVDRGKRRAVRGRTRALQLEIRVVVNATFGGSGRAGNAIRSRYYEDGNAGLVWSKLGRREGVKFVDYLLPFVTGAVIRPVRRRMLLIPFDKRLARRVRRGRVSQRSLHVASEAGGRVAYLIFQPTNKEGRVIGVLVRQARHKTRLKIQGVVAAADEKLARAFLQELEQA